MLRTMPNNRKTWRTVVNTNLTFELYTSDSGSDRARDGLANTDCRELVSVEPAFHAARKANGSCCKYCLAMQSQLNEACGVIRLRSSRDRIIQPTV